MCELESVLAQPIHPLNVFAGVRVGAVAGDVLSEIAVFICENGVYIQIQYVCAVGIGGDSVVELFDVVKA